MTYSSDINNRTKESVTNLQKLMERQITELEDKIFKLQNVMDKNNKSVKQSHK